MDTPTSQPAAPVITTEPAAKPTLVHPIESILDRLNPAGMFPRLQPLEVELGSGDGSFLARYAHLHPERNFIGVERLLGRLRKLDRKGQRAGLANLRCIRLEAMYVLEFLVPPGAVSALHIYFPDPWPKRKHRKHRIINERFPVLASQALAPGGTVYLRTDDADYFTQMRRVFDAAPGFASVETPGALSEVVTDFERNFNARGVTTLRAAYRYGPN